MGVCTSDFYKIIKQQHGEIFEKYIVGSESLIMFKRLVRTKQQEYDAGVEIKRQFLHSQVRNRQQLVTSDFQQVKSNLDAELPGGIKSYEQVNKVKVQVLLGLEQHNKRIAGIHDQIDRQIDQRRQNAHKQLQQSTKKAEDQFKIDPQKINMFQEMPAQRRTMIQDKGVEQFKELIENRLQELQENDSQQMDINKQLGKLDYVISLQHVDHLVSILRNKFKDQAANILAGAFDGEVKV